MAESAFARVRQALTDRASEILKEFGVHRPKGDHALDSEWNTGYKCPLCTDESGSASFTRELYLKCHQCSFKGDVFVWMAKSQGKKPWDVCKQLASRLGLDITPKKNMGVKSKAMPPRMTEALLARAIHDLWEEQGAEPARRALAERGLDDQVLLSELGVGWVQGVIVFAQRFPDGTLTDRYRSWQPNGHPKWLWSGKGNGGPGIWPMRPVGPTDRILLLEGESDTLTAFVKLRLHEEGWHPCTWTAGATSCPHPKDIPRGFSNREIHICYDNDVFQGPNYSEYYVQNKASNGNLETARTAAQHRLKNLLCNVAPLFSSLNCEVVIRQCPIDPQQKYGGDFRDWVDSGGRDLTDWKAFPFEKLPTFGKEPLDIDYDELFGRSHEYVRVRMQVDTVRGDDLTIARTYKLECGMGQHPCCAICPAPRKFPERLIEMVHFPRELAVSYTARNPIDFLLRNVVQPPHSCPRAELVPQSTRVGSDWTGIKTSSSNTTDAKQRTIRVISEEPPSLSGDVEVTGTVYPQARGDGVMVMAQLVKSMDRPDVDLAEVSATLDISCPRSDDPEKINQYLDERWRDLAYNVTKIHGRRDIQVAHDLLAHSVIDMRINGARHRGWLDICVFGETRSGKSLTFRRMFEHHELGIYHAAVGNISRAGLIMGADKSGALKPGLLPKANRKMLMLDEWHFLCQGYHAHNEHPMSWMQSGRDEGRVSGIKIYGSRDLPAKVRLACIANWMGNRRKSCEYACEHIAELYGAPETVARLDFALAVGPLPSQDHLDVVADQIWTRELTRALILRAWSQAEDDVIFDDGVVDLASSHALGLRETFHYESLPLYTPEEKIYSILRIAISIANLCFSHPKDDWLKVWVRRGHVEWAVKWLRHTWEVCEYDTYSRAQFTRETVVKPFEAEKSITVGLGLEDPAAAQTVLACMMRPFSSSEFGAVAGKDHVEASRWTGALVRLRVIAPTKGSGYGAQFVVTKDGHKIFSNLMALAMNDPEIYVNRYRRLSQMGLGGLPSMPPITSELWELSQGEKDEGGQVVPFVWKT